MKQDSYPKEIILFVDRLVEEKGLEGLDSEVLEQVKTDLLDRVVDHVNAVILGELSEKELADLEILMKKNDADLVQAFYEDHILNLDQVIATALLRFRAIYMGV